MRSFLHPTLLGLFATSFLIGLSRSTSVAQIPDSLDSLERYAQTHPPTDTHYVNALIKLGDLTSRQKANYDRADSLLRAAEKIALKLNFGRGIYRSITSLGSNYYLSDHPQQTLEYLQKALTAAEAYKLAPRSIANAITNLGTAYRKVDQPQKALEIFLRSLRMQEQFNVQPRNETTYTGIGLTLKSIRRPREAIGYFMQALAITQQLKEPYGIAIVEQNLGKCYDDLDEDKKALAYYRSALRHAKESKSELLQSDILVNTGLVLRQMKRFPEAKSVIGQALGIARKQENKSAMSTDYFNLGQVHEELKEYGLAEQYMKKALALAHELGDKNKIADYTQGIADLYGGMKSFQQAYVFQLERNQQMDSTTSVRTNAEIQRMIAHYETEQKEARIKLLQQQAKLNEQETDRIRFRNNALLVGVGLLLLLGVTLSAWLLNRSRLRRLEDTQRLRQQIAHDLHDEIGSTLSSISMLSGHTNQLLSQNKPESAQKMVQKIYSDARQILESIDEIIWTINPGNDSLHRIALRLQEYANPLMESKGIHFQFAIDPSLDQFPVSMAVRQNLYLIGKEAVNNLVKYSQATEATVRFELNHQRLQVVVEDNGRGFDLDQPTQRTGHLSMQQRASAIGGKLAVQSAPGHGTRLQLTMSWA